MDDWPLLERILFTAIGISSWIASILLSVAGFLAWRRCRQWQYGVLAIAALCLLLASSASWSRPVPMPFVPYSWLRAVRHAQMRVSLILRTTLPLLAYCLALVGGIGLIVQSLRGRSQGRTRTDKHILSRNSG